MAPVRKETTFAAASLIAGSVAPAEGHSSGRHVFAVTSGFNLGDFRSPFTTWRPP